ncbi:MAG: hypothetical protein BMS9Abin25_0645 [Gammaproteobacteria bacterium]|nr:MAG: hypothetical protein BMS9Abin25_0645 [Gammaproteobacteria bacterium]
MNKILVAFVLLSVTLGLTACSGSGNLNHDGDLNVSGNWRVVPFVDSKGPVIRSFTIKLSQQGNKVTGTNVSRDPLPAGFVSCGDDMVQDFTGVVADNRFNGSFTTSISTTQFSVSGRPASLSGSFTMYINTGICTGSSAGTVTMTRI